jgi:hypothetical protein
MPLLRYFLFVGGTLLALLFVSDAVLPKQPLPSFLNVASSDQPFVRIHSERKWPERIVFDTSVATVKPAIMAEVQAAAAAKARVREAFAQLTPPVSGAAVKTEPGIDAKLDVKALDVKANVKPDQAVAKVAETKPQPKRKVAKARPSHPLVLVAQQPQQPHFGFFDSTW